MKKETSKEASIKQIFYDQKKLRWKLSRNSSLVVGFLFILMIFTLVSTILNKPNLPALAEIPPYDENSFIHIPDSSIISKNKKRAEEKTLQQQIEDTLKGTSDTTGTEDYSTKTIAYLVNWDDKSFDSLKQNIADIDLLVPEWFHLQGNSGEIRADDVERQKKIIEYVRQVNPDLKITPLINNFDSDNFLWDDESLAQILKSEKAKSRLIQNLLSTVQENDYAGIHVDFESIPLESKDDLTTFIVELQDSFKPFGLEVSQSVPLSNPSFDIKALGQANDFIVLMAYDQHTAFATSAGPVAGQNWFNDTLSQRFAEVPNDKVVVGIGNYGYEWIEGQQTGRQVDFLQTLDMAEKSGSKIALNQKEGNPTFTFTDEQNIKHEVWFLDAVTAFNEIAYASNFKPKGYAIWRLGAEDPLIWDVIRDRENLEIETVRKLAPLTSGYDLIYKGKGDILRVTSEKKDGFRKLEYNQSTGYITNETYVSFPSSLVISRQGAQNPMKIALTFDDGPDSQYTPEILQILKKQKAKATFFVVGRNVSKNPEILKDIYRDGHDIGSHTFTHPNITKISPRNVELELNAVQRFLESTIGRRTLLFRPPFAEGIEPENSQEAKQLIKIDELGYYSVSMSVDPRDWFTTDGQALATHIVDEISSGKGNVVLLHDSGGDRSTTIDALPNMISGLRERGYELVTVSELMGTSRDLTMPVIASGRTSARINFATLKTADISVALISFLSLAGISIGVVRSLFISTLAVAQWRQKKKRNTKGYSSEFRPFISVVVPAYNEEKVVNKTINSLLSSTYYNLEIVVVDDGSKDKTLKVLHHEFHDLYPKVRIFGKENGGKSEALNYGIERSGGEIIIALDADTQFKSDTIEKLIRHFEDKKVGAVAGNAKVGNRLNFMTKTQTLEYITSQNLDRRALEVMNGISVVPGAVGAWRKEAILEAGSFSHDTLAEDADLTFAIIKNGYKVLYEDEAIALTEAPDNIKAFVKQRFRWMYGTLQTTWKHRNIFLRPKHKGLGLFTMPNVVIFQIIFPLISPIMDLVLIYSIGWAIFQKFHHPNEFAMLESLQYTLIAYSLFLAFDMLLAIIGFLLEPKENKKLLVWAVLQRFFYRQLMYFVAIKTLLAVLKGALVGWGSLERKGSVEMLEDNDFPSQEIAVETL